PWSRIGANMSSDPAAVSSAAGRLDVFARGQDNALYLISSTDSGASWQPWQRLGGNLASAPAASSWGQGRLDVFALGRDLNVYHLYSSGGTGWQYWPGRGGACRRQSARDRPRWQLPHPTVLGIAYGYVDLRPLPSRLLR